MEESGREMAEVLVAWHPYRVFAGQGIGGCVGAYPECLQGLVPARDARLHGRARLGANPSKRLAEVTAPKSSAIDSLGLRGSHIERTVAERFG